ncbi:MAG: hypothetical protein DDT32_00902 [Syntrophomonadaceae bacterium]|nr:hypothetical protein [Bacillota bacterium]MBT9147150.1 hypothetical protein [Bacillota bacterium]
MSEKEFLYQMRLKIFQEGGSPARGGKRDSGYSSLSEASCQQEMVLQTEKEKG